MLSKSQARAFFIGFTVLFSGVFLFLTVDTVRQVPARSHADQLGADAIAGKGIWESNNCMGCHTILGEGAYYAPELTRVIERRGAPWIKIFLKDPEAMFPGRRKMVKYDFTDQEIDELIAFFTWIGNIDTNGFPAKPDMTALLPVANAAVTAAPTSTAGAAAVTPPAFFSQVCVACHAVAGKGGNVGPALDGVATRFTADKLDAWLKDPQSVKPGTAMPQLGLTEGTRAELVAWLMLLQ